MLVFRAIRQCLPFAAALVLAALLFASLAPADAPTANAAGQNGTASLEAKAQAIFSRVLSPYCPGLPLASCTSGAAESLRNEVRASLRAGDSSAALEERLQAELDAL